MEKAEVIQVIRTESKTGKGTTSDPIRIVIMYWALNGKWLASNEQRNYFPDKPPTPAPKES